MAFSSKSDTEHLGVHNTITNLSCLSETSGVFQLMQGQSKHLHPDVLCGADLSCCVSPRSWGSWTDLYSLTLLEPVRSWPRQKWPPGAASWFLVYLFCVYTWCMVQHALWSLSCFLLFICFSLSHTFSQLCLKLLGYSIPPASGCTCGLEDLSQVLGIIRGSNPVNSQRSQHHHSVGHRLLECESGGYSTDWAHPTVVQKIRYMI